MQKIYLTGPESSGKTTLAKRLSEHYACPWVPEYARQYLAERQRAYKFEDLELISRGQLDLIEQSAKASPSILIADTEQLVLYIWSLHKFGKLSIPIERRLKEQKDGLHLLCRPDLAWEEDVLRENPKDREELFENYKLALDVFELEYAVVEGQGEKRLQNALTKIETFMKK